MWSHVYVVIPALTSGPLVAAQPRISIGRRDVSNEGEFSHSTLFPQTHDIIVRDIFQKCFIITQFKEFYIYIYIYIYISV